MDLSMRPLLTHFSRGNVFQILLTHMWSAPDYTKSKQNLSIFVLEHLVGVTLHSWTRTETCPDLEVPALVSFVHFPPSRVWYGVNPGAMSEWACIRGGTLGLEMHDLVTRFCCIFMIALSTMWTLLGTANIFFNAFVLLKLLMPLVTTFWACVLNSPVCGGVVVI